MKVTFAPKALTNLARIYEYIAKDSPQAASRVIAAIEKDCLKLGEFPGFGRPTDFANVRVLPVGRYPYLIFYTVLGADRGVRILRVRHGARKPLTEGDL